MRLYLDSLKVRGHKILSEDTMNYLTAPGTLSTAYEFKQEGESDQEFLRLFSAWLHEYPQPVDGHTEYYLLMGLRLDEHLTKDELEFLERNVADCFDELNHRLRHRLRITLIMSQQKEFRRLIKKDLPGE